MEPRQPECGGIFMFYTACQTWVFYYIKWAFIRNQLGCLVPLWSLPRSGSKIQTIFLSYTAEDKTLYLTRSHFMKQSADFQGGNSQS